MFDLFLVEIPHYIWKSDLSNIFVYIVCIFLPVICMDDKLLLFTDLCYYDGIKFC